MTTVSSFQHVFTAVTTACFEVFGCRGLRDLTLSSNCWSKPSLCWARDDVMMTVVMMATGTHQLLSGTQRLQFQFPDYYAACSVCSFRHYLQNCIQAQQLFKFIQRQLAPLYDVSDSACCSWGLRTVWGRTACIPIQHIQLTSVQIPDGIPLQNSKVYIVTKVFACGSVYVHACMCIDVCVCMCMCICVYACACPCVFMCL